MRINLRVLTMTAIAWVCLMASASHASDTCREWWREHESWKARVVALYLGDGSQQELDAAMFEVIQLEAYLTACEGPLPGLRARLVANRTIDRPVDEYAAAVAESLLEQAGFDLSLESYFMPGERAERLSGAVGSSSSARY
jgi:hypothetical protein